METNIAIQAAIEAGIEIMKIYTSADFGVETKSDDSPLTLADKKSHEKIVEILSKTNLPILSEESKVLPYKERKNWETFWLVDPLDGTKEFIKKNGEFTVNIAMIQQGDPIFGVIYVPVQKKLYFTEKQTSYMIEEIESLNDFDSASKIKLQKRQDEDSFVIVASKSHLTKETQDIIDTITKAKSDKKIITKSVGSSLKLCLVAEGEADFYPRYAPTMEWDIAAGHAICKYAGISVNQADKKTPVVYNKENLLNPWFEVGTY